MAKLPTALALAALTTLGASASFAEGSSFDLELNSVRPVETGCRLAYVAHNGTGTDLSAISYEVAIFDAAGTVSRLLILEYTAMKNGQTKVVQFDIGGQDCTDISRLLVNGVAECTAVEGDAPDCMDALNPSSRVDIAFGL